MFGARFFGFNNNDDDFGDHFYHVFGYFGLYFRGVPPGVVGSTLLWAKQGGVAGFRPQCRPRSDGGTGALMVYGKVAHRPLLLFSELLLGERLQRVPALVRVFDQSIRSLGNGVVLLSFIVTFGSGVLAPGFVGYGPFLFFLAWCLGGDVVWWELNRRGRVQGFGVAYDRYALCHEQCYGCT